MLGKTKTQMISALEVFAGGACYGANATMYKLAYADGFSWPQVVGCQMWFAAVLFGIVMVASCFLGKRLVSLEKTTVLKLMGLGALSCVTAILYCFAMSRLPVAVALTLLFQFTWIGLVIQVAITHRPPRPTEIIACIIILGGTVLASNVYKIGLSGFDPIGIVCGFMSAVSCALFVALSGRVQPSCSSAQRGFIVCLGSGLASLFVCPDFLISGVIFEGIARYGFVIGLFGMLLPVLLFGLGAPNLPAGVSTALAASELPAGLIISMTILKDDICAMQWVGVVAILLGVVVSQLRFGSIAAHMDKDASCPQ